jgi:hypothetical protein
VRTTSAVHAYVEVNVGCAVLLSSRKVRYSHFVLWPLNKRNYVRVPTAPHGHDPAVAEHLGSTHGRGRGSARALFFSFWVLTLGPAREPGRDD